MKILFVLIQLIPLLSFSQLSFDVVEEVINSGAKYNQGKYLSLNNVIIINSKGSSNELFNNTVNWINETYQSPDDVILSTIEGKYLRFNGVSEKMYSVSNELFYDGKYNIEIRFKDNMLRFEILDFKYRGVVSSSGIKGWRETDSKWRVENLKGKLLEKDYFDFQYYRGSFNSIVNSLNDYLNNDNTKYDW